MAAKRHRLAQRRKTVGFTQETLAEQLGVDSTTVRRWESGETETGPQPWLRPKLARYLQVSLEQLEALMHESVIDDLSVDAQRVGSDGAGADRAVVRSLDPQQSEVDAPAARQQSTSPSMRPDVLVLRSTIPSPPGKGGPPMRAELLTHYEGLTDHYRQIDYQAGAWAVYGETVAHLNRLLATTGQVPSSLYRRFVLGLGDAAQLAAWLAIDSQDYGAARQYCALALSSAEKGEDPNLHAYVLGVMSYIHLHAGRGDGKHCACSKRHYMLRTVTASALILRCTRGCARRWVRRMTSLGSDRLEHARWPGPNSFSMPSVLTRCRAGSASLIRKDMPLV